MQIGLTMEDYKVRAKIKLHDVLFEIMACAQDESNLIRNIERVLKRKEPDWLCKISQAALETGFFDQSHLSRNFKRIVGITPGQYVSKSKIVQDTTK